MSIGFAQPWALLLLLLVPVWWVLMRGRRAPALVFSRAALAAQADSSWRTRLARVIHPE